MSYTPFKMKGFPKLEGVDLTKKPTKPSIAYQKSNEQDNKELDAKEDATGKGKGSNRKVMKDGVPEKLGNPVKSDAQKKVIAKKKEYDAMSDTEKKVLQEKANQRKRDFDKERAKKGK